MMAIAQRELARDPSPVSDALADVARRCRAAIVVPWTPALRARPSVSAVALLGPRETPTEVRVLERGLARALVAVPGEPSPRWIGSERLSGAPIVESVKPTTPRTRAKLAAVVEHIRETGSATTWAIAHRFDLSRERAGRLLTRLVRDGAVRRVWGGQIGGGRSARYEVL